MDLIKSDAQSQQAINELIKVVSTLRDPVNGCPWDIKQNHESLIPYAIEEAHEVADAIRYGNDENLCDELGDLLLQVIFHAQIANEENRFGFQEIAKAASRKMIRRHPHVFGDKKCDDLQEVQESWESIKEAEKNLPHSDTPFSENLRTKARSQSALSGAIYISKQVSKKQWFLRFSKNH